MHNLNGSPPLRSIYEKVLLTGVFNYIAYLVTIPKLVVVLLWFIIQTLIWQQTLNRWN